MLPLTPMATHTSENDMETEEYGMNWHAQRTIVPSLDEDVEMRNSLCLDSCCKS